MITRNVNNEYFQWLCSLISDSHDGSYKKLLTYLNSIEFSYILPMDSNRYFDGINLRYRFGYEKNIEDPIIASCLDNKSCSVLEMMVALAFRIEEQIMVNPANGMMSGRWFWMMIRNLGLASMTDGNFDSEYVNYIIYRFMNRDYGPDGEGSLVYMPGSPYDLRRMEIWYQMMRYLTEYNINEGE